jgi:hypothetical protein
LDGKVVAVIEEAGVPIPFADWSTSLDEKVVADW